MSATIALGGVTTLASQAPGRGEVRVVIRAENRVVAGATIVRIGAANDTAVSDTLGRARIGRLGTGLHRFLVRQVGFQPFEFDVVFHADTIVEVDVPLQAALFTLDTIRVDAAVELSAYERKLRAVGFEERRLLGERTATDATFITPADIELRKPMRLSHLLEGQRSIRISYRDGGNVAIPLGRSGYCVMSVWVDGQEMKGLFPASSRSGVSFNSAPASEGSGSLPGLDIIAATDVAAVEIYPSPTGTPPQFQNLTGNCGAIVIWTKQ